ncbi:hypothetical protein M758_8G115200 [Ceratodon purpureus]|nr:hypothetical protein M758_8G115200 [Ceratodon purpureus]
MCRSRQRFPKPGMMELHGGCGNRTTRLVLVVLFAVIINGASQVASAKFNDGRRSLHQLSKVARTERDYEKGDQERQEFFEVSKPVDIPEGATEVCSLVLLQHTFANTINDPPTLQKYTPHPNCDHDHRDWTLVVLRWHATCKGRQFDRISAVWLSGVEIFRTCTAEPTQQGIFWTVEKDITRFKPLFTSPQLLALELANVVDNTYTGIYNVTLSAHFYTGGKPKASSSKESYGGVADVILPFAETSPLNGGYWFQLQNESDVQTQKLTLPSNAYKAVLEICVSFHGPDEFWYTNPPNDFLEANNLTDVAGNGTFREVLVSIDGLLAGVVYPFPVFYTGGVDPYFWRPISAIGSFVLPSYDVDITPFLPTLVDSKPHLFSTTVTSALPYWLLSANLHLWLDPKGPTSGALSHHSSPPLTTHTTSKFKDLDGKFTSEATRSLSYKGHVISSFGNLTTAASYSYRFSNTLVYSKGASVSDVHQESKTESKLVVKDVNRDLVYKHTTLRFPLKVSYEEREGDNKTVYVKAGIEHAWEEEDQIQSNVGLGFSSFSGLQNKQRSKGQLVIPIKGAISGVATTKQRFALESSEGCYFRSVGASNYTFLYDESDRRCSSVSSY